MTCTEIGIPGHEREAIAGLEHADEMEQQHNDDNRDDRSDADVHRSSFA
jgi:hypothetical protein